MEAAAQPEQLNAEGMYEAIAPLRTEALSAGELHPMDTGAQA
jgi:hypothetical protein